MLIRLDMASDVPIYQQLRNQIVLGIGSGKLKEGDSLPTVRQLAEDTGVNVMTVNKAYALLKNEGFLEIDRRHGAKVSRAPAADGDFCQRLEAELSLLIAEARARNVDRDTFLAVCHRLYDNLISRGGNE
ncbi:MAG: GntR family transcriptional regulator [Firmicutes bacterium]|nr:GntR family transcriptional regulator [Bacillota bacterium]